MNADEFKAGLKELGVSQRQFADEVEMAAITINRWANGKADIPGIASAYLRIRLQLHRLQGGFKGKPRP